MLLYPGKKIPATGVTKHKGENMSYRLWLCSVLVIFTLSACGGGGSGSSEFNCTLPCLSETPTISDSSVMSATGGTVTIDFKLTNDAANVVITLMSEDPLSLNPAAGVGSLINVQGGVLQQIDIVVNAGTALDVYYPVISVTANQLNSGSLHYLDFTKSSSRYTYNEVIGGNASTPQLSPYAIPKLTVN